MVAIKDMVMPSSCYDCHFAKNDKTNDYGSFSECGILEDGETINLLEHSKHPNCPLIEIQERKVGEWEKYCRPIAEEQHYICTNCNNYVNFGRWGDYYTKDFRFCPHCGAEMRGCENG